MIVMALTASKGIHTVLLSDIKQLEAFICLKSTHISTSQNDNNLFLLLSLFKNYSSFILQLRGFYRDLFKVTKG